MKKITKQDNTNEHKNYHEENKTKEIMSPDIEKKSRVFDEMLNVNGCFDMIKRCVSIGNRKGYIYTIDGFTNGAVMQRVVQFLIEVEEKDIPDRAEEFAAKCIPHGELIVAREYEEAKILTLSGMSAILIDGFEEVFVIDCREFPARGVSEPTKDKTLRGSRDGFVETMIFNVALLRRRIRTEDFTSKLMQIGTSSKTDVSICYIKGRTSEDMLDTVFNKLKEVKADALSMNVESLAECIYKGSWFNPFPKFKYTERPDVTAASILEGNIVIFVDNCPSAMIIPTTVFDIIEDTDDYYFAPVTGTYLRLSRLLITLSALVVSPLFLLVCQYPEYLPEGLRFMLPKNYINVPIVLQFLLLEFAIDGLKLASLNTPDTLSTSLSVIAGIVVGEFAISSGWFNEEVLLCMALVALANYSHSSFELGYALKFMRTIILITTAIWGIYGFATGIGLVIILIGTNKTVTGTPYLSPIIPLDFKKVLTQFLRVDIKKKQN